MGHHPMCVVVFNTKIKLDFSDHTIGYLSDDNTNTLFGFYLIFLTFC